LWRGAFTAADIAMFMTVHYAIRLNGPRLDSFPALADWYRRIGERPSAARVVQKIAEADRTVSWPLSARGPVSQSEHYRATPGNRAFDPEWNSRLIARCVTRATSRGVSP